MYLIYSEATSIQLIPLGENHQDPNPPLTNVFNVVAIAPVYSKTGIFFSDIYNGSILYRSLKENNTVTIREGRLKFLSTAGSFNIKNHLGTKFSFQADNFVGIVK